MSTNGFSIAVGYSICINDTCHMYLDPDGGLYLPSIWCECSMGSPGPVFTNILILRIRIFLEFFLESSKNKNFYTNCMQIDIFFRQTYLVFVVFYQHDFLQ